ncbi:MAG: DUF3488 and transglutaminase-like domain-containing protein [Aquisalimonadaceae bacterium]
MSPYAVTQLLPQHTLALLLLSLSAVAAPHLPRLPVWIGVGLFVCVVWRYLAGARGWRLPPRLLLLAATVAAASSVYVSYGTLLGLDAGVATLTAMLGLKLLELRHRRDTVVALYLGFFLVLTQLLYSTTLFTLSYMLAVVWVMTTLLITVTRPGPGASPLEHGRLAAALLLQALPIMVLLFVLFPRIPGPLWGMPEHQTTAVTGLSDSMSPGSIGELSQSSAVAFRVEFEDQVPRMRDLYWRGLVLPAYDGRTWRQSDDLDSTTPTLESLGNPVDYIVTMEPNNMPWVIALEMPTFIDTPVLVDSLFQLRRNRPVRERLRYRASSTPRYRLQRQQAEQSMDRYLYLPDDAHPRTIELAQRWRKQAENQEDFIYRALEHFREQPFVYTLSPPVLRNDTVDEFLFDIRRGFCEHFAGAFAVMMRAGGTPSRVVLGYQGGEINPAGGYLIVRQSEAHAWVELFIEGAGWQRFDPTAWVAPERIESGLAGALPDTDFLPALSRRDASWTRSLALRWDAVNAYWDRWVLAYGPELQQRLMEYLGLGEWQRMVGALAASMALAMGLLSGFILWRGRRPPRDPAVVAWETFCTRLARAGIARKPHEGPSDFAARAARRRPDLAATIEDVARNYIAVRYSYNRGGGQGLSALQRAVAGFRA